MLSQFAEHHSPLDSPQYVAGIELWHHESGTLCAARRTAPEQMPVSLSRRPFGSHEVTIKGPPRPIRFMRRVYVQNEVRHLTPICTCRIGIEHAYIRDGVLFVIDGERWTGGRQISDIRIECRLSHVLTASDRLLVARHPDQHFASV